MLKCSQETMSHCSLLPLSFKLWRMRHGYIWVGQAGRARYAMTHLPHRCAIAYPVPIHNPRRLAITSITIKQETIDLVTFAKVIGTSAESWFARTRECSIAILTNFICSGAFGHFTLSILALLHTLVTFRFTWTFVYICHIIFILKGFYKNVSEMKN